MSLWLCLRFEQLPLQCLNRSEEHPVAVVVAQRVLRANDCATALGVRQGMGAATVRALAAEQPVQLLERDEQAEARCLEQLCCWAYSITPTLQTWRDDCLQLEIEGCLTLFKGLDALLTEVASGISGRGYQAHMGLAATPAAAWLLSFSSSIENEQTSSTHRETASAIEESLQTYADEPPASPLHMSTATALHYPLTERLGPLPLSLLIDFSDTVNSLRRAGLHHFSDLLALPPAALSRRCGKPFTYFLQQVLGQREEPAVDYKPPATFSDEYWFGYEVKTNTELMPAIQRLLQSLCQFLRNTQLRTSDINWRLIGIDQKLRDVRVCSASSHSDWQSWYQLSRIRFERLELSSGVEGLGLECASLLPGELENFDLFSPRNQREPLAALLDRLRNRLGLQAIEKVGCRDEHLPELAVVVSNDQTNGHVNTSAPCAQRPFWLMPEPQQVRERGQQLYWSGKLELIYGPERIEDNWWKEPVCRDYYIAAGHAGHLYWVFRERLSRQWFIHGIFA